MLTLHLCNCGISSVMLLCITSICKLYISLSTALDFQFSQEVVSVAEENRTVSVCVEMASDGNLFRNVEIRVISQDGNATGNYIATHAVLPCCSLPLSIAPGDYTAVNITIMFLVGTYFDGPGFQRCISIVIEDEDLVELDETFLLTADSSNPNVNIMNTATVNIINIDGR